MVPSIRTRRRSALRSTSWRRKLSNEGTETKVRAADVMVGGPAHVIASIADESGAGLIVTGTRGHTAVSGLLLGGVTLRLLHIARKPVLAVPEER